jgi:hypothetical protein
MPSASPHPAARAPPPPNGTIVYAITDPTTSTHHPPPTHPPPTHPPPPMHTPPPIQRPQPHRFVKRKQHSKIRKCFCLSCIHKHTHAQAPCTHTMLTHHAPCTMH